MRLFGAPVGEKGGQLIGFRGEPREDKGGAAALVAIALALLL